MTCHLFTVPKPKEVVAVCIRNLFSPVKPFSRHPSVEEMAVIKKTKQNYIWFYKGNILALGNLTPEQTEFYVHELV